jgi:hypothetical protein
MTRSDDCASGLHGYCNPCECPCHQTWQPIATAPKDGTKVLVYATQYGTAYWGCAKWMEFDDGSHGWIGESFTSEPEGNWTTFNEHPTHWLPLPAPPGETPCPVCGHDLKPGAKFSGGACETCPRCNGTGHAPAQPEEDRSATYIAELRESTRKIADRVGRAEVPSPPEETP